MSAVSTIAHDREGAGEPLVLIHGIGHRRQAWDPVVPLLVEDFEVITLDLPGFGESPPPDDDHVYDMPHTATLLDSFFEHIGIERPHVAGNSLGGAIALELGALDLVRSVTALAPAGFWTPRQRRYALTVLAAHRRTAQLPEVMLRRVARHARLRTQTLRLLYGRPERVSEQVFLEDSWSLGMSAAFDHMLNGGMDYECMAQPAVPTAIAWGDRDRILLPAQGKTAAARLPRAEYVELPGCGHIPMTDDPERVAAVIRHAASLAG